ncbi:MAG TPA: SAM-dependent chlorinase/fluorinase [Gemmatimonadales bacterium]|nr:SAM-dependent chlorinase/fluorinase [Gemmatimonadales bacterium]
MPLITFLTDYGTADSYVGEVKGVIASLAPGVPVVDLTHHVPPGDVRAGHYLLSQIWPRFPEGTIHLAVVDPGVGTQRLALALEAAGHYFVGPDNGLLTSAAAHEGASGVVLPVPPGASVTFHGRDLFAPAAAALGRGEHLVKLGHRLESTPVMLEFRAPHYEGKTVIGEVIYVDRFGNLVTSLTPAEVPGYATVEIEETDLGPLRTTFGDVPSGNPIAYIGSTGRVEIAVRGGSAARRFGISTGGEVRARLG